MQKYRFWGVFCTFLISAPGVFAASWADALGLGLLGQGSVAVADSVVKRKAQVGAADVGVLANYTLSSAWATQLSYEAIGFKKTHKVQLAALNFRYRTRPTDRVSPIVYGGAGLGSNETSQSMSNPGTRLGVGVEFFLNDNFSLTSQIGHQWISKAVKGDHSVHAVSAGMMAMYYFSPVMGQPVIEAAPEPTVTVTAPAPPTDSDHDSVPDSDDACPNTAAGTPVNEKGCPIDADQDGVLDERDQCLDTPAGQKVDETGCKKILKQNVSVQVNVLFSRSKATIPPAYYKDVKKVADFLNEFPNLPAVIEGYTDNQGQRAANLRLSKKRAEAVRQLLIKKFGIRPSRITSRGYGASRFVASNKTEAGRRKNRRVIAVLKAQRIQK